MAVLITKSAPFRDACRFVVFSNLRFAPSSSA
jgi:hypothetical protein